MAARFTDNHCKLNLRDSPRFIVRIHGPLEIRGNIVGMKIFAPAFVAVMILVTMDQMFFYGRYTDPVFGTLRYLCKMTGIDFRISQLGPAKINIRLA